MSTYSVSSTVDPTTSSAYQGYTGAPVVAAAGQGFYADNVVMPTIPQNPDTYTNSLPRHGENVASPTYLPAVNPVIAWLAPILKLLAYAGITFTSVGYVSWAATYYTRSKLWFIDAVYAALNAIPITSFNATIASFKAQLAANTIVPLTTAPTGAFTTQTAVAEVSSIPGITTFGGAGVTLLVAYNKTGTCNVTMSQLSTAGTITILIVQGNLTITSDTWYTGAANPTLIICTGTVQLGATGAAIGLTQANLYVAAIGNISIGTGGVFATNAMLYHTGALQTVNLVPYAIVGTSHPANSITRITGHDDFGLIQAAPENASITNFWFNPAVNDGSVSFSDMADGFLWQTAFQYGIARSDVTMFLGGIVPEIRSVVGGKNYTTTLSIYTSADSLPNVGVHTEPFNYANYVVPMAQSYRVDNTHYTFYKAGGFIAMAQNGDFVINAGPLVIPAVPYTLSGYLASDITIDAACTVSESDAVPIGMTGAMGGMDPYTLVAGVWTSTYRQLNPPVFPPALPLAPPLSMTPPNLGLAAGFAILSQAGVTDATGNAVITGDVGASPISGAAIHTTAPEVTGNVYEVDAAGPAGAITNPTLLTAAVSAMQAAYTATANLTGATALTPADIGGQSLVAGLYKATVSTSVTTANLTLTGSATDVWIFQITGTFNLANGKHIVLAGGALATNVYWQISGAVTLGTTSIMQGTILAQTGITLNTSATLNGRALAQTSVALGTTTTVTIPVAAPLAPSNKVVIIKSPYSSYQAYAPMGGFVSSSFTYIKNSGKRSDYSYQQLTVLPSSIPTLPLEAGVNLATLPPSSTPIVTFMNNAQMQMLLNGVLYMIANGDSIVIGTENYEYVDGALYQGAFGNIVLASYGLPPDASPITITVITEFDDMLNSSSTRVLSQLPFAYSTKQLDSQYDYFTNLEVLVSDMTVDTQNMTPSQLGEIQQTFSVDPVTQMGTRVGYATVPVIDGNLIIDARIVIRYAAGATMVPIDLVDGTYGTAVVAGGLIDPASLPITVNHITYVGLIDTSLGPVSPPGPAQPALPLTTAAALAFILSLPRVVILGDCSGITSTFIGTGTLSYTSVLANQDFWLTSDGKLFHIVTGAI